MHDLNIAEIPYDTGETRFRYSRYLSSDGSKWIRHGPFTAYYKTGALASEGSYQHGAEHGAWRDFHMNGQVASEGDYENGVESGVWKYWAEDGTPQAGV